jgi:hypothetical protein
MSMGMGSTFAWIVVVAAGSFALYEAGKMDGRVSLLINQHKTANGKKYCGADMMLDKKRRDFWRFGGIAVIAFGMLAATLFRSMMMGGMGGYGGGGYGGYGGFP